MPQANILLKNIPTFPPGTTVGDVRDALQRKKNWDSVNYIYLVSAKGVLKGVVSMKELLRARATDMLDRIASKKVFSLHSGATPERAALLAVDKNIKSVPVVDEGGVFLGVIGTDDILATLHRAGIRDIIRHAGIHLGHRGLVDMLHGRAFSLMRRRLPWLLIGLLGALAASAFVGQFESYLTEVIELAFFIPSLVYMADAAGTQTQEIFLRAITFGDVRVSKFLVKQIIVDLLIGGVIGFASFVAIVGFLRNPVVALIVGISMFAAIVTSGLVAVLLTVIFARRTGDPVLSVGPFATVIQDLMSLLLYFTIASVILSI